MDSQTVISVCTIAALVAGPVAAVIITLWAQDRAAKRSTKERLFVTPMAHRKSYPPTVEWVSAINTIVVVYANNPKILSHWDTCYRRLSAKPWDTEAWNRDLLDLLSAIAEDLGYKHIRQTQIDKFYVPDAHNKIFGEQDELRNNLLRVLKATKTVDSIVEPSRKTAAPDPLEAKDL